MELPHVQKVGNPSFFPARLRITAKILKKKKWGSEEVPLEEVGLVNGKREKESEHEIKNKYTLYIILLTIIILTD